MSWDSDWNDQADQDWMRRQAELDDIDDDLEHDEEEEE